MSAESKTAPPSLKGPHALERLRQKLLACRVLCGLIAVPCLLVLALLAAFAADAIFILSDQARGSTPWILGALSAALLAALIWFLAQTTLRRVARQYEFHLPELGTALTNAVQLSTSPANAEITEFLRRQAVEYGGNRAASLSVLTVARPGLIRALLALLGTGGLCCAALGIFPDVCQAVLPRFLDPQGDHPPYSRLKIDVTPEAPEVLFGGQCEIRATATGMPVERLFLVVKNAQGTSETVMFRRPDQSCFQSLANLRETTQFWVTDGRARSLKHTIRIRLTPQIEFVELEAAPPAYTGLRAKKWELKQGDIQLLPKTELSVRAGSNRPLKEGRLELTPLMGGAARSLTLQPDPQNACIVRGSFTVTGAEAFAVSVTDIDGLRCGESRNGRIMPLRDQPPRIDILEPGRHALATPEITVPVRVRAEDDYGVAQLLWFRALNGSVERSAPMSFVKKTAGAVEAQTRFNLKELGVRPGDKIEYFFEAADNWPDGPNVAASRIFVLEIISLEQYKAYVRAMRANKALFEQYYALNNHVRRLKERAKVLKDSLAKQSASPGGAEARQLREQTEALDAAIGELLKSMDKALASGKDFDIEQAFEKQIRAQRDPVERLRKKLSHALEQDRSAGIGPPIAKELADAYEDLDRVSSEMDEKVGQPARRVDEVAHLVARANEFAHLAVIQGELAKRSKRFNEKKQTLSRLEQMEVQELAAAEQRVRDGLKLIMESLPELLEKLPQEPAYENLRKTTGDFIASVKKEAIQSDLDQAAEKFAAMNGFDGRALAQTAAEKMDRLVEKCCANAGQEGEACLRFQPSLASIVGNSLAQILAAMSGDGGGDGSGMGSQQVGLYGPEMQMPEGGGKGDSDNSGTPAGKQQESAASDAADPGLPGATGPGRVKLQRDVRFPLQHRTLVGEYFRTISESMQEADQ